MDDTAPSKQGKPYVYGERVDRTVLAEQFLQYLISQNAIEPHDANRALKAHLDTGQPVDVVLSELGLIQVKDLVAAQSSFCQLAVTETKDIPGVAIRPNEFSADYLLANLILPLRETAACLVVATARPFEYDALEALCYYVDKPLEVRIALASDITSAIDKLYQPQGAETSGPGSTEGEFGQPSEDDLQRLRDRASEAPIVQLVHRLVVTAVAARASDIHIEPLASNLCIRHRIDGTLLEVERLGLDVQSSIVSRIKILAGLNIAENRMPQDGRAKFVISGREIDVRVSTTPVMHGESIVLRLLDKKATEISIEALGFDQQATAVLEHAIAQPNGIVLVTGPTGSGKTTTLYAALQRLNSGSSKVFSIEDPIEYEISGVNQIQVRPGIGLNFAHAIRSILRQDPDTIMVGELRDIETVRAGIQAALTGHLVLSTLHTNNACATVTRLLEMGGEDYLIGSTLISVFAQRLVRCLCAQCTKPSRITELEHRLIQEHAPALYQKFANAELSRAVGCKACYGTGYFGRTSIVEALAVSERFRSHIKHGVRDFELLKLAQADGMKTLVEMGLEKVLVGTTTIDEVLRVSRS